MAKLRIDLQILEDMIFGFAEKPVRIGSIETDGHGIAEMEITGEGVPDADEVLAICSIQANRAGQRLVTMTFKPI
jgi:hypothetical protein